MTTSSRYKKKRKVLGEYDNHFRIAERKKQKLKITTLILSLANPQLKNFGKFLPIFS